jgi:simple sugar transport system ATP-binding protein
MSLDETRLIGGLPVGYMQFVEIAREIDKGDVRLLVFDEPTAVLTESEAQQLLEAMKELTSKGIGILFITHRLDEIMRVADQITILRDGVVADQKPKTETSIEEIASKMVGRKLEVSEILRRSDLYNEKDIILDIQNLRVGMPGEEVHDVSLQVQRGEILGIGGLAGGGKIGIANGIMGLVPASGTVMLEGVPIELNMPKDPLSKGIAFVSEDRRGTGLLLDQSIEMNIVTPTIQVHNRFLRKKFLSDWLRLYDTVGIREHALKFVKDLDIRCTGPDQLVRRLSGGNQQKVCLARAFSLDPKILFVSEPTRGIDVGAKKIVLDILVELNRNHDMTIIMTSSELGELRKICDRIAIVAEGHLAGILQPDAPDVEFGLMMSGQKTEVV